MIDRRLAVGHDPRVIALFLITLAAAAPLVLGTLFWRRGALDLYRRQGAGMRRKASGQRKA